MKALDKSKPFAQVYGDDQGRAFEQDGAFFRGDGSPWGTSGKAKPAAAASPAAPAPAAPSDQLTQQLQG